MWERFRFAEKVGTKHCNAAAGSYLMPDAYFYTLSEQTDKPIVRVFRGGKIIASPYKEELSEPGERILSLV
jgi:hypothetical protein